MFLSHLFRSPHSASLGLMAAGLLLVARPAAARAPRIPADAKGFQRTVLLQESLQRQALSTRPAAEPRHRAWNIPPGAPLRGSYTYYAPPKGYKVIREATPSAPRYETVIGPDGSRRTFRLEGPVVMRLRYVADRGGAR